MRTCSSTRQLRGGSVGALVGPLTIAAHGMAGGGGPGSADLALVLLISVLTGFAATARRTGRPSPFRRTSGSAAHLGPGHDGWSSACRGSRSSAVPRDRALLAVFGWLAFGQLAGHAVQSVRPSHTHDASRTGFPVADQPLATHVPTTSLPTGWMLTAHVLATLVCAVLILAAGRIYAVASTAVRAVLTAAHHTGWIAGAAPWSNPGLPRYCLHPNGAIGPRAPPVPA